jgi:hyperosmotically inducible protein
MKRTVLVFVLCLVMVSFAYAQKDVTSALKERATNVATEKATAVVDDSAITAEVKLRMADTPSLKEANVSVQTTDGVVTLTGTVKNKQVKGVATKVAKKVKGVKSVNNQLAIEKPAKKATKAPPQK